MMRKGVLLTVLMLLFVLAADAHAVYVDHTYIEIKIDKGGDATITESYWLIFESLQDELAFERAKEKNETSLSLWKTDYEWFYPKFGNIIEEEMKIKTSNIIFEETENKLVLQYVLHERFAEMVKQEARLSLWRVPNRAFSKFLNGSIYVIPENVRISIIMPEEAQIRSDLLGYPIKTTGNVVELGGTSIKTINVYYEMRKPIGTGVEAFSLSSLLNNRLFAAAVAAALILFAVVAFFKGSQIKERVEDYIVEHTELEKEEEEIVEIEA
jgi:hypothetical protein